MVTQLVATITNFLQKIDLDHYATTELGQNKNKQ